MMTEAAPQPDLFDAQALTPARRDAVADDFCARVLSSQRRAEGITFTPHWLVERMLDQACAAGPFDTVIDPGAGSGRFTFAAARRFPSARVWAVERNPALAEALRRRVREEGLVRRVSVVEGDFRSLALDAAGRALYIGNPPYVRHHDIEPRWKDWYAQGMALAVSKRRGWQACTRTSCCVSRSCSARVMRGAS